MKYRTFLTTLALFLFTFNLGIVIISITTFKDTIHRAQERSLDEHYFITSALLQDFYAVGGRGTDIDNSIPSLLQPYSYLAGDQNVTLVLFKDKELVYSNSSVLSVPNGFPELPGDGSRLVSVQESDGNTSVLVSGKLPAPYDVYTMVYLYDITDEIAAWRQMKNMLFFAGLMVSALFAFGLHILLSKLFRPLSQISQTSRQIAAGAYDTRLPVSGQDELTEMAQSFNHMAKEIQSQIQQLATAAQQKQQFIDNFAHELRTPLTTIYGYAEYIQKVARTEDDKLFATTYIMSESRRLQQIAYRLLELATLRENKIEPTTVQIKQLFLGVEQALSLMAADQSVRITSECHFDSLECDPDFMHILLVNFVDNALKACGTGGQIKMAAFLDHGQKGIMVEDNGKGMSAEHLLHITEAFYRVDPSRTRNGGGAGLGLTLCKQIADCHGAELSFSSEPGKGTIAKLIFPAN
ncbi:HAMP domain-containing histidine kinase [Brevibacillus sp. HB1.2]|uniref:sensor histidine kinase n=1 Tax=Brevibacillus TaxID=55080 RepID=UPI00035C4621|nr:MULTISPECIES: HAMP domain-containing sensor histidine kinase [unclassified Brevibacillus]ATF11469.1 sensor histidine kinase [Brevibacillus brevis X23]NTU21003.1 HAMP domain-containing histidine kinase [Brevibacillus sp. HB1.2]NTU30907.1 HAMP domain-containing histidine kinase [Brevibacillus sp. HB1.1]